MGKNKKLFTSEDFDKQKKLFTSEDFDKQTDSNDNTTGKEVENKVEELTTVPPQVGNKNRKKLIGGIVTVVAFVILCILFIPKSNTEKPEEKPIAEVADTTKTDTVNTADSVSKDNVVPAVEVQNDVTAVDETATSTEVKDVESEKTNVAETAVPQKADVNVNIEGSTETLANEVIAGKYANWPERERKLGKRYKEIQSKVNEMYRKGLVK